MRRPILGLHLPDPKESYVGDVFVNTSTGEVFVFDDGAWQTVPQADTDIPAPTIADAGKAVIVGEDGKFTLGEGGGGGGSVYYLSTGYNEDTGNPTYELKKSGVPSVGDLFVSEVENPDIEQHYTQTSMVASVTEKIPPVVREPGTRPPRFLDYDGAYLTPESEYTYFGSFNMADNEGYEVYGYNGNTYLARQL